jgi:hypothetical protein
MIDEAKLFAWLDGELGPDEAAEVETRVAADARLSALAAQHRQMQTRLSAAFDSVANLPVPHALRRAVTGEGEVVRLRNTRGRGAWGVPQWAAMAATLAVGIFAGNLMTPRATGPVAADGGKLYAAAALDHALDTQLASAPAGGAVRVGLTFRDRAGTICRSFTEQSDSGVACLDGNRWQVRGLFASTKPQQSDYRMAAGPDPRLMALVDSMIAGEPLDAAQERAARDRGWK